MEKQGNYKKLILSGIGVAYILVLIILFVFHYLTSTFLILLLALTPLIIININTILYSNRSVILKGILLTISVIFILVYYYIINNALIEQKTFAADEFGILFYDNVSGKTNVKINKKNFKKMLESIKPDSATSIKSVRVQTPAKNYEFFDDPILMKSFITNEINEFNASIAILFHKIVSRSVCLKLHIAPRLIQSGFPKDTLEFYALPAALSEILKINIEPIVKFKRDVPFVELGRTKTPKSKVERMIASNHIYNEGIEKLKQAIDIPDYSPERRAQFQSVEHELKRAIELDPSNDKSYAMLGYIKLYEQSDYDSAAIFYEKAKQIHPESYSHTLNLAQNYFHSGRKQDAIRILKDFLEQYGERLEDEYIKIEMRRLIRNWEK